MNVGILRAVVMVHCIDHRLGLVAGRAVVEVDQRLAMDPLFKNRKIRANTRDIEVIGSHGWIVVLGNRFHRQLYHLPKRATRYSSKRWRKDAIFIRPTTSLAKAKLSKLLAWSTPSPRERR